MQTEINIPNIPLLVINSVVGLDYPVVDFTNDSGGLVVVMVSSDGDLFYDYKELQSDIGNQTVTIDDGFRYYRLSLSNDRNIVSNVYENLGYQSPYYPFNFSINFTDRTKFDIVALQDITIILGTIVASLSNSSDGSLVTNMQSVTYHVGQLFHLYNSTENQGQSDTQYHLVNAMTYDTVGILR
jgi:hypothetical protein